MKKKLIIALYILSTLPSPLIAFANAEEYIDFYDPIKCTSNQYVDVDLFGYVVHEGKVYYSYCEMDGMDPQTISPLIINDKKSVDYAQDKANVYYQSRVLTGLKPGKFKSRNIGRYGIILYNNDTIYFNGSDITDANPDLETLEIVSAGHYGDKNQLYRGVSLGQAESGIKTFTLKVIEGADPDNFEDGYKVIDDAVYWYGVKIEEADAGSFEMMECDYSEKTAKDKDNVFWRGEVIHGIDSKSFAGLASNCFDKNSVYNETDHLEPNRSLNDLKKGYKSYDQDAGMVNDSIKSALLDYKEKYPGYRPQPAIDPDNPPKYPALDRLWDIVTDYKYLNPPIYYLIILSPILLVLGVAGFVLWRRGK